MRGEESVRFWNLRIAPLLFADDVVLLASSDIRGYGSLPENSGFPPTGKECVTGPSKGSRG